MDIPKPPKNIYILHIQFSYSYVQKKTWLEFLSYLCFTSSSQISKPKLIDNTAKKVSITST